MNPKEIFTEVEKIVREQLLAARKDGCIGCRAYLENVLVKVKVFQIEEVR